MTKKKDAMRHLRTEKAMRAALRAMRRGDFFANPGKKYYELEISTNDVTMLRGDIIAIFDLRRCIVDRPALKGIKKMIGRRRK